MKRFDNILVYAKYFILSKYGIISVVLLFLIWMLFFDDNNFVRMWRLMSENSRLRRENAEYEKIIKENETNISTLTIDVEALEKYARRRYFLVQRIKKVKISYKEIFLLYLPKIYITLFLIFKLNKYIEL